MKKSNENLIPGNTIAYQGVPGANSHIACLQAFPDMTPMACDSFEDAFSAVQVDGKAYIYKVNSEDSRGEMFAYMVDRALNLQSVPGVHAHQYGQDAMKAAFEATHPGGFGAKYGEAAQEARKGGGHLMELCPECKLPGESTRVVKKMMETKAGRNEFNKLTMIDFMTGNHDRHGGNWMIHPDGKVVAIDNAYRVWDQYPTYDKKRTMDAGNAGGHGGVNDGRDWRSVKDESGATIDASLLVKEAGEFFDEHFDAEALKAAATVANVEFKNLNDVGGLRQRFIEASTRNFSPQMRNLGTYPDHQERAALGLGW